jgi:hypothetical protein
MMQKYAHHHADSAGVSTKSKVHCGVEVTESSTNKQLSHHRNLSADTTTLKPMFQKVFALIQTLDRVGRAIEYSIAPPCRELPVPESLPSPPFSVSINASNRHLTSHSCLTTSNWIMPVYTSQSLPPLCPCLTTHFRQG